jgi:endonuclease-3
MLIATLLSQNTNDRNSYRAYRSLRHAFPKWSDVLNAPVRSIAAAIRTGGMANQKSRRIKEILSGIKGRFGRLSLDELRTWTTAKIFDELLALKGVGVKTAACVLVFSLGRDVLPVDTHIHRICGRLGLAPGCRTPEQTFDWMKHIVPNSQAYTFHTNLIRFGRKICRSQTPLCGLCPVYHECGFQGKKRLRLPVRPTVSSANHDFMLLDNIA